MGGTVLFGGFRHCQADGRKLFSHQVGIQIPEYIAGRGFFCQRSGRDIPQQYKGVSHDSGPFITSVLLGLNDISSPSTSNSSIRILNVGLACPSSILLSVLIPMPESSDKSFRVMPSTRRRSRMYVPISLKFTIQCEISCFECSVYSVFW